MATKKTAAEECCAKCESDIAALKKEIAALKRALKAKSSGGVDPRVDKLIEAVLLMQTNSREGKALLESLN